MTGKQDGKSTPLGIYDRARGGQVTGSEMFAAGLCVVWLLGCGIFFLAMPAREALDGDGSTGALGFLITMMAMFMPVGMILVTATALRASRVMREESQRLQTAIDAIRQSYVAQTQGRTLAAEPSVARKLDEIAAATRKTETALAKFTSSRQQAAPLRPKPESPARNSTEHQADLPLGTPAEEVGPPLSREDFIRALNFPETAEDEIGFAALRKALRDRQAAQLVQASQDVLTLLSQDGIYMDDLRPDMARAEIWRRFAQGERGRVIAALGGIRDRSSLALTAGRMKQDPIFRDAAHHFLRRFDKMFIAFEQDATDTEISDLSNTRTARAFMLLGRVAGIFD